MLGYEITDLSKKTQVLIKEQKLDTNGDGLINEENGELANLLSATGKQSIQELGKDDNRLTRLLWAEVIGGAGTGLAMAVGSDQAKKS